MACTYVPRLGALAIQAAKPRHFFLEETNERVRDY